MSSESYQGAPSLQSTRAYIPSMFAINLNSLVISHLISGLRTTNETDSIDGWNTPIKRAPTRQTPKTGRREHRGICLTRCATMSFIRLCLRLGYQSTMSTECLSYLSSPNEHPNPALPHLDSTAHHFNHPPRLWHRNTTLLGRMRAKLGSTRSEKYLGCPK